jgi:hypothetical protein
MRSRTAAALAACMLAVLPTAGCYQGFDETVNTQGPTGNGTDFLVGEDLKVQDTTLVVDPENPSAGNLIMTIINEGEVDDALVGASIQSAGNGATEGPIEVPSGAAVQVGGPNGVPGVAFLGLTEPPGSYATVTLQFRNAGSAEAQVAVVLASGYYEEYGPSIDAEG